MDIRRIQKTGTSTMTVSLPKDWINSQGLKAGDSVSMQVMPDGTVSVDPRSDRRREPARRIIRIEREESEVSIMTSNMPSRISLGLLLVRK